jgi:hypothetical protein
VAAEFRLKVVGPVREEKMSLGNLTSTLAGLSCIVFLLSLLYWLRQMAMEVNSGLPSSKRIEWGLLQMVPPLKIHWIWQEHLRLFPKSHKRTYVALSLLLLFLIPIVTLTMRLLAPGAP